MKPSYKSTFGLQSNTGGWNGHVTNTIRKETRVEV